MRTGIHEAPHSRIALRLYLSPEPDAVKNRSLLFKIAASLAIVAGLLFAMQWLPLVDWLRSLQSWFTGLGTAGVLLFAALYAVAAIAFVPCLPWTVAAGVFFGFVGGLTSVLVGSTIGAAVCFLLARALGRRAVAERLRHNRKFTTIDHAIGREGWKIVILLRMLPVPFGLSNYLYGLTAIDFWHYMFATWVGMLYGNVVFVYLGAVGKQSLESGGLGQRHPLEYALTAVSIVAAFSVSAVLRRIARNAVAEAEKSS